MPATPEILQRLVELELMLARLIAHVRAHSPRPLHLDDQDVGIRQIMWLLKVTEAQSGRPPRIHLPIVENKDSYFNDLWQMRDHIASLQSPKSESTKMSSRGADGMDTGLRAATGKVGGPEMPPPWLSAAAQARFTRLSQ